MPTLKWSSNHLAISGTGSGLWPTQVAQLYGIPSEWDGAGQCVGVIALGGNYHPDDVRDACRNMQRPAPLIVTVSVPVDGVTSDYSGGSDADEEAALDVQILAGIIPGARIVVYCAPSSEEGLASAIQAALSDTVNRPGVLSVSFGYPEKSLTNDGFKNIQDILSRADERGVSIVAAAGDFLATAGIIDDSAHVLFPASSEFVIACGGTQITLTLDGTAIEEEIVWSEGQTGSDGGISDRVNVPDYQLNVTLPESFPAGHRGRGVPDVAGAAGQNPGYRIVLGGNEKVVCGTSAPTPIWAALIALANAKRGKPLGGAIHQFLYRNPSVCKQIIKGDNRSGGIGYYAGPGWNACTGWGVPNGVDTVNSLAAIP